MVEDGWIWGEAESAGRRRLLLQPRGGEGSGLVGEGHWVSLRSALEGKLGTAWCLREAENLKEEVGRRTS